MTGILIDNVPSPLKAHDVRKLTKCKVCGGIGHQELMVFGTHHTRCYKVSKGFPAVLALPYAERTKYRLRDLTTREFAKLLDCTDELTND